MQKGPTTYAVQLTSKDNLTIGTFATYDDAASWLARSIFHHEPHLIIGVISPRPDHRAKSGGRYVDEPRLVPVEYGRSPDERDRDRQNLDWMIDTMRQGKP
jgi:hypothetical protein